MVITPPGPLHVARPTHRPTRTRVAFSNISRSSARSGCKPPSPRSKPGHRSPEPILARPPKPRASSRPRSGPPAHEPHQKQYPTCYEAPSLISPLLLPAPRRLPGTAALKQRPASRPGCLQLPSPWGNGYGWTGEGGRERGSSSLFL